MTGLTRRRRSSQFGFGAKWLLWWIALAALAVLVILLAQRLDGNVIVLVPPYHVRLSLAAALIALMVLALAYRVVRWLWRYTLGLPGRWRARKARRRQAQLGTGLQHAMMAFFNGRYTRAERLAEGVLMACVDERRSAQLDSAWQRWTDSWIDPEAGRLAAWRGARTQKPGRATGNPDTVLRHPNTEAQDYAAPGAEGLRPGLSADTTVVERLLSPQAQRAIAWLQRLDEADETRQMAETAVLLAAQAAHELRELARRDAWLEAVTSAGDAGLSRDIARLRFSIMDRRADLAQTALNRLGRDASRHIATQRLALQTYRLAGRWEDALKSVRLLANRQGLPLPVAERYQAECWSSWLASVQGDAEAVRRVWRKASKSERHALAIVRLAARAHLDAGLNDEAQRMIEAALEQTGDRALYALYARCQGDRRMQFNRAEAWCERRPSDPWAPLLLIELCLQQGLWGKAQQLLLAQLKRLPMEPAVELTMRQLAARYHQALNEPEAALVHWERVGELLPMAIPQDD